MTTPRTAPDVVGVTEFAAMAGVARNTVATWVARGTHPELPPSTALASGRIWRRRDVQAWVASRAPIAGCSKCARLGRNCAL